MKVLDNRLKNLSDVRSLSLEAVHVGSELCKLGSEIFEVSLQGLGSGSELFILGERTLEAVQQPLGFRDESPELGEGVHGLSCLAGIGGVRAFDLVSCPVGDPSAHPTAAEMQKRECRVPRVSYGRTRDSVRLVPSLSTTCIPIGESTLHPGVTRCATV